MNAKAKAGWAAAALMFGLSAMAPAVQAQSGPPVERSEIPYVENRPASIRERQIKMDEMTREASKGAPPRRTEELRLSEISEDYRELQQVNNKMMKDVMSASAVEYESVIKSISDIRRRAERLRLNLTLPVPETGLKPGKPAEDSEAFKAALLMLDRSVTRFVRSSLFKNTDVFDAEAATKTGRDLADIIELSGRALKDAETLGKRKAP